MRTIPRIVAAAIATACLAGSAGAQGTRDYTGPMPHTNLSPLTSGVTPPTPNRQTNIYSPGYAGPRLRRIHPGNRVQRMRIHRLSIGSGSAQRATRADRIS
jgi:hypothetical protein